MNKNIKTAEEYIRLYLSKGPLYSKPITKSLLLDVGLENGNIHKPYILELDTNVAHGYIETAESVEVLDEAIKFMLEGLGRRYKPTHAYALSFDFMRNEYIEQPGGEVIKTDYEIEYALNTFKRILDKQKHIQTLLVGETVNSTAKYNKALKASQDNSEVLPHVVIFIRHMSELLLYDEANEVLRLMDEILQVSVNTGMHFIICEDKVNDKIAELCKTHIKFQLNLNREANGELRFPYMKKGAHDVRIEVPAYTYNKI